MPCIKPVSDLRNYNEVLQNVTEDSPVFLTKIKSKIGFLLNSNLMESIIRFEK